MNSPFLSNDLLFQDGIISPTIGNDKNSFIAPEFLAYLNYLKFHKYTHTYFNMQDNRKLDIRKSESAMDYLKVFGVNDEHYRARVVESVTSKRQFYNNFFVLTLGKDNSFYNRTGKYSSVVETKSEFVGSCLDVLFLDLDSGYYISHNITFGLPNAITFSLHLCITSAEQN